MQTVAEFVVDFLYQRGIADIFTVTGGGIMYLCDALGRHPRMRYVCAHHEQACAIAAEAYARVTHAIGACLVTTGPGSTNALSGIAGAWVDSIPVFVVSGQVRRDLIADYSRVRQLGPQEIDIESMARNVTKYCATIMDPNRIAYEMEKAAFLALLGRPGPVWINIPLDVQGAVIDENRLVRFDPSGHAEAAVPRATSEDARRVLDLVAAANRPVLIPGNGIHLAGATSEWLEFVEALYVPVLLTIGSTDLIAEAHPCYAGRFGPLGQRAANLAVQNADLVVAIGASMSLSSVGFNTDAFAPRATKVMVNVDAGELAKARPRPDVGVVADARDFIARALELRPARDPRHDRWRHACATWRAAYPPVTVERYADKAHVNSYVFAEALSDAAADSDIVLTGNSLDWWSVFQAFRVKDGQRVFTNANYGAMGWDLPAAIGASVARRGQRVILVTGDGSLQFNVQELQTIVHNRLPLKVFVFNNGGYNAIRVMQESHFAGRLVGAESHSGVSLPDLERLAPAYGLRYARIQRNIEVRERIAAVLSGDDPVICEVSISPAQGRTPRVMSYRRSDGTMASGVLENMFPFLPAEEVERNMRLLDE